jgi:alanyl aminopeptidase
VFPSFDEPGFKVPMQLSLIVKSKYSAFSNAPLESEEKVQEGWSKRRFKTTPPLPTYLFALAVGTFEHVKIMEEPPMRLIVPKRLLWVKYQ